MALVTGDLIHSWAGFVALETAGASIAAGAMSAAATTELTSTNHENAPLLDFGVVCEFGANAPTADKTVSLYAKINTVDGTAGNDSPAPSASYKHKFLGSAVLSAVTGTQYLAINSIPLPGQEFDVYVFNGDDTDAMTWKLYVNPKSAHTK